MHNIVVAGRVTKRETPRGAGDVGDGGGEGDNAMNCSGELGAKVGT